MDMHDNSNLETVKPTAKNFLQKAVAAFKKWKKPYKFLAIMLIFMIPLSGYAAWYYYRITRPAELFEPPINKDPVEETKPPEVDWDVNKYFSRNIVNIVLLGFDGSADRDAIYSIYRTDTIKVVSLNFDEATIHIIDIPRDTYTRIANTSDYNKINSSYYFGYKYSGREDKHAAGIDYTLKSVSNILGGIPLHYYASVDMDGVVKMVDSIGGVKFDVPFDVYDTKGKLRIEKGEQILKGKDYLWYLRTRAVGGDIGRVNRQTELLLATLDHFRAEGLVKNIPTLYTTYQKYIDTNLTNQQIISLALYVGKLGRSAVQQHTLKGPGQSRDGIYYMVLDRNLVSQVMHDVFGIDYMPPAQSKLTDTIPSAPKSFAASIIEQDGKKVISLTWQQGDSHNREYNLYRSVNSGEEICIAQKITEKGFIDNDIKTGNSYRYRLEAVNYREVSDSVTIDITIEASQLPPADPPPVEPENPEQPQKPEEPQNPKNPEEPPESQTPPKTDSKDNGLGTGTAEPKK